MYRGPQEQVQAGADYPNTGNPGGAYNMDFNRLQSSAVPGNGSKTPVPTKPTFNPAVRNTTPMGSGLQAGAYRPNPRYTPPTVDAQGNVTNSGLQNFDLPFHNGTGGPGGSSMGGMMDPMAFLRQLFGPNGVGQPLHAGFTPSGFPQNQPLQPNQVGPNGQVGGKPGAGMGNTFQPTNPLMGGSTQPAKPGDVGIMPVGDGRMGGRLAQMASGGVDQQAFMDILNRLFSGGRRGG